MVLIYFRYYNTNNQHTYGTMSTISRRIRKTPSTRFPWFLNRKETLLALIHQHRYSILHNFGVRATHEPDQHSGRDDPDSIDGVYHQFCVAGADWINIRAPVDRVFLEEIREWEEVEYFNLTGNEQSATKSLVLNGFILPDDPENDVFHSLFHDVHPLGQSDQRDRPFHLLLGLQGILQYFPK